MRLSTATDKLSSGASNDVLANLLQLTRRGSDYGQWKPWIVHLHQGFREYVSALATDAERASICLFGYTKKCLSDHT
jgi:hypothetical protein